MTIAATPTNYTEIADATPPSGFDPVISGAFAPFISLFNFNRHTNINFGQGWDAALGGGSGDYTKSLTLGIDGTTAGTYPLTSASAQYTEYVTGVRSDYYGGTIEGVNYPNATGSITITLYGANRIVGSYTLHLEISTGGTFVDLFGDFDLKRDCDFHVPIGGASGGCPGTTPVTSDLPVLTGTPTTNAVFVFDDESFGVDVPVSVAGAGASLGINVHNGSGLVIGGDTSTGTPGAGASTVAMNVQVRTPTAPATAPAGNYYIEVRPSRFTGIPILTSIAFASYKLDPYYSATYYALGEFNIPNYPSFTGMQTYFAPTTIQPLIIEKAPSGYAAFTGDPWIALSATPSTPITTAARGDSIVVVMNIVGPTAASLSADWKDAAGTTWFPGAPATVITPPTAGSSVQVVSPIFTLPSQAGTYAPQITLTNSAAEKTRYFLDTFTYPVAITSPYSLYLQNASSQLIKSVANVGKKIVVVTVP